MIRNIKIISGGQSGVDRAALSFALENNIPCGGWCPKGRLAEDGPIDKKYPLKETNTTRYVVRTKLNVDEGDGTLILYTDKIGKGTRYTSKYAALRLKHLMMVNISENGQSEKVKNWLEKYDIETLNIAGPRESSSPGIYQLSLEFLEKVLKVGSGR